MGEKKKKDGKTPKNDKGANGQASLVPKSIAGVKLPKDVRGKLAELAKHPVVADLVAAGLVALAARIKNEPKVRKQAAKASDAAADGARTTAHVVGELAAAVAAPLLRKAASDQGKGNGPSPTAAAPATAPKPRAASSTTKAPAKSRRKPVAETGAAKPRAARRPAAKRPTKPPLAEA